VTLPADAGYDAARSVYNAAIDRRPALIVRCAAESDVLEALHFARSHHLPVAVRGHGHSLAGSGVCDGGIVIDLSRLKRIDIDPIHQTVRMQPGLTWGEFDRNTAAFGLATTGSRVSTVGTTGVTLGGGLGWLMRSCGLSCDNLLALDVVTAEGRQVSASESTDTDLLWAMRGAGANFGIVTSLTLQLHPVHRVLVADLVYPLSSAFDVLRHYRDLSATSPDELAVLAGLMNGPDGDPLLTLRACYTGAPSRGETLERSLRIGTPLVDQLSWMTYPELQSIYDVLHPLGRRHAWRNCLLENLGDDALETLLGNLLPVPSGCKVFIDQLGGAIGRVDTAATAFGHRDARYSLLIESTWNEPIGGGSQVVWANRVWRAMRPFATDAVYVNFLDVLLGRAQAPEWARSVYGQNYARLAALKARYDPSNVFSSNVNIQPSE
jgi:FAD/FMN-containing dehydrogenase